MIPTPQQYTTLFHSILCFPAPVSQTTPSTFPKFTQSQYIQYNTILSLSHHQTSFRSITAYTNTQKKIHLLDWDLITRKKIKIRTKKPYNYSSDALLTVSTPAMNWSIAQILTSCGVISLVNRCARRETAEKKNIVICLLWRSLTKEFCNRL